MCYLLACCNTCWSFISSSCPTLLCEPTITFHSTNIIRAVLLIEQQFLSRTSLFIQRWAQFPKLVRSWSRARDWALAWSIWSPGSVWDPSGSWRAFDRFAGSGCQYSSASEGCWGSRCCSYNCLARCSRSVRGCQCRSSPTWCRPGISPEADCRYAPLRTAWRIGSAQPSATRSIVELVTLAGYRRSALADRSGDRWCDSRALSGCYDAAPWPSSDRSILSRLRQMENM